MRDLAFIAFLAAIFALGFRRPFLLVLAYVYIDIVSPQRLTYLLLNTVPISLIAVALAVGGWLIADDKRDTRVAPRQLLMTFFPLREDKILCLQPWECVVLFLLVARLLILSLQSLPSNCQGDRPSRQS